MSKTVGTGGTNIDGVLDGADRMLEKVAKDNASGAAEDILERRAQLLLSFAETAERIGDYGKQLERIMFARGLLDPVCGGADSTRTKCRHLFADTYRAEGDHLRNVGKSPEARKQYQVALELRPVTLAEGAARGSGELATVRAHTGIAMAFLAEHSYDDATAAAESCLQAADGAKLSEAENDKFQLARAGCLLAGAIAARDHKQPHFIDTLSKAEDARTIYNGALRRDSHDINSIGGLSHALEIIGTLNCVNAIIGQHRRRSKVHANCCRSQLLPTRKTTSWPIASKRSSVISKPPTITSTERISHCRPRRPASILPRSVAAVRETAGGGLCRSKRLANCARGSSLSGVTAMR